MWVRVFAYVCTGLLYRHAGWVGMVGATRNGRSTVVVVRMPWLILRSRSIQSGQQLVVAQHNIMSFTRLPLPMRHRVICVPAACALLRTSKRRVAETARNNRYAVLRTVQRAARSPVIADAATAAYALVRIVFVPRFASVNMVDHVSCGSISGNWFARRPSKTGCG